MKKVVFIGFESFMNEAKIRKVLKDFGLELGMGEMEYKLVH